MPAPPPEARGTGRPRTPGRPLISVIIPAHDAHDTLPLQLESLAVQHDAPAFEVIVVDNASVPPLDAVVAPFRRRLDVRVVRADEHRGASYARNAGIGAARASLLMFCDADDVVSRWWLRCGAEAFEHVPLWSGSALLQPPGGFDGTLEQIRAAFDRDRPGPILLSGQDGPFPVLMGGTFGITRQAMERVGGFDQSFPVAGDDNDLGFRARAAGLPVLTAGEVRIAYRGHWRLRDRLRSARASARAHSLLATRYDAWADSPFPPWWRELPRCAAAAVKMAVRPRQADWVNLALRTGIAVGLAEGAVRYRWLHRVPPPQIGLGWDRAAPARGREAA